jgi:3-oxoacyl-[acyl-carrier-protein] synthase II
VESAALAAEVGARKLPSADRTCQLALLASDQALRQAGLITGEAPFPPREVPVLIGSGAGCMPSLFEAFAGYHAKGVRGIRPTTVPRCMTNAISSSISMHFRLTGTNFVTVSACSASTIAIGLAFRMIRDGYAEQVLCGGADAPFDPLTFGSWDNLGVMSRNPDPAQACRPFDAKRDGCVLGEGAAALIVESAESAKRRGAAVRASILGYGESSDADHITRPSVEGQARAMALAIQSAGLGPGDIGFVSAHGTATKANDECESQSLRAVLGPHVDRVPVLSNKSYFGHLLGASGAVETVAAIIAMETGTLPPNLNLVEPDPLCSLRLVGSRPEPTDARIAMKNSFGFGGTNAVLILGRT